MYIPSLKLIYQSMLKKSPENTDGRTDGRTDGHCHGIIRPFFKRAYKNKSRSCRQLAYILRSFLSFLFSCYLHLHWILKSCHAKFVVRDCLRDNHQCRQWRQSWHPTNTMKILIWANWICLFCINCTLVERTQELCSVTNATVWIKDGTETRMISIDTRGANRALYWALSGRTDHSCAVPHGHRTDSVITVPADGSGLNLLTVLAIYHKIYCGTYTVTGSTNNNKHTHTPHTKMDMHIEAEMLVISAKFSSPAALNVVILTTSNAAKKMSRKYQPFLFEWALRAVPNTSARRPATSWKLDSDYIQIYP